MLILLISLMVILLLLFIIIITFNKVLIKRLNELRFNCFGLATFCLITIIDAFPFRFALRW